MGEEDLPLLRNQNGCKPLAWFISLLTDLPCKVAAFISGNKNVTKLQHLSCLQLFYVILRMFIIIVAQFTEVITSFREDRLDEASASGPVYVANSIINCVVVSANNTADSATLLCNPHHHHHYHHHHHHHNQDQQAASNDDSKPHFQLYADIIILDVIIIALLLWVLLSRLKSFSSTDTHNLSRLVDAANYAQPDKLTKILFVLLPLMYITFSVGVSFMYLLVYFKHTHFMWPAYWEITGALKIIVFAVLLIGKIATDLLYIQIILRYVIRCQLNIYFLQLVINKFKNSTYGNQDEVVGDVEQYQNQDEVVRDVERSWEFIEELNKSSRVTGFAIIIALVQATNSAINLLNEIDDANATTTSKFTKECALICRLILSISLIMVPFYQATQLNETAETLINRFKIAALYKRNTRSQRRRRTVIDTTKITLKVKLFGFPIPPWFVYVGVSLILLSFALRLVSLYKYIFWQ